MGSVILLHVDQRSEVDDFLEEIVEIKRDDNSFLFGEMESSRAEKRTRVVDVEENWIQVGRRVSDGAQCIRRWYGWSTEG